MSPVSGTGPDPDEDRWLRETLNDAVSEVEPRRGLEEIQDALHGRSRRLGPWAAGGAGLLVAATVAGIALAGGVWSGDDGASPAAPVVSPSGEATTATSDGDEPDPTPESEPVEQPGVDAGPLPVYYVGDTPTGPRLFREFRASTVTGDALGLAVDMAVSVNPLDPDYYRPWPEGVEASATFDEDADLITIDLSSNGADLRGRPSGVSGVEGGMALEQLMYTAQAVVQARPPVRFLINGSPADKVLGVATAEPLAVGDPMQVQAPVWVISPQEGKRTDGRVRVEGRGAFFEANVSWQVLRDGSPVREGFTTAEECCTLSPFSFTLPALPPGDYVLRVYDADVSGGEGSGEQEDTKSFSIGPVS